MLKVMDDDEEEESVTPSHSRRSHKTQQHSHFSVAKRKGENGNTAQ
jgi:hypothetical protein